MTNDLKPIWIGLVRLIGPPESEILQGGEGAFTHFISQASNESDFLGSVESQAREIGLRLDEVEWSEPISERLEKFDVDDYLLDLARNVADGEDPCFGTFHVWEAEE